MHLIDNEGKEKNDVKVPDAEIGQKIEEYSEAGDEAIVTIISAMGEEAAISVKDAPK